MPIQAGSESVAVGDRQRWYCSPQAAGGTPAALVGADPTASAGGPLRVLEGSSIDLKIQHEELGQSKAGPRAYVGSSYEGMKDIGWTLKTRIIPPRDLAGTVRPEIHHLLLGVMGAVTVNAGTSLVYAPGTKDRATLLTVARLMNTNDRLVGEWLADAIPDAFKFVWNGSSPPEIEFSGKAAQHIAAAITTLDGAVSGATSATITHAKAVDPQARVSIGSDTNGGAGYQVTARNVAGTGLTLATSVTAADQAEVRPFMPDPTYSDENAFGAIEGSLTLGGEAFSVTAFELNFSNSTTFVENEVGSDALTDGVPGEQVISGSITVRATERELRRMVARKDFDTSALVVTMGDGTTNRNHTLSAPQIRLDAQSVAPADDSTTTIEFVCLDSADNAADALTWTMA